MTSSRHGSSKVSSREARIFRIPRLVGADLQGLIAPWSETLQLPEDVATAPFGVSKHPGSNLLPLPFKGVCVGAPPAEDASSPLLLSGQGVQRCCRIRCHSFDLKRPCCTPFDGKEANGLCWLLCSSVR